MAPLLDWEKEELECDAFAAWLRVHQQGFSDILRNWQQEVEEEKDDE